MKIEAIKDESSVLQDDLRNLCRALGLPDAPRPQSPHEVFGECIAEVERRNQSSRNPKGEVDRWTN